MSLEFLKLGCETHGVKGAKPKFILFSISPFETLILFFDLKVIAILSCMSSNWF